MADEDDVPELGISTETVCWVIARARAFDAKEAGDGDADPDDDDPEAHLLEEEGDTIAEELRDAIAEMNEDEQAALIALAWIGRGEFDVSEWDEAVRTAKERNLRNADDYLVGMPLLGDYLEEGLSAFGLSCD
ncbi:DUF3775 domain-containing protein [Elioraea tepidiphila]|jgi:hypothetical protein|uniref:DUF3775 domain-containing protein n=1 Tax=Elioraea tepidiphila TaxID=457934 RepID=UPI000381162E|nr:DUF3775 domain-containing protein [Elioraea tepidiphila]